MADGSSGFTTLSCDTCSIQLQEVARIQSGDDGALLDFSTMFRWGPNDGVLAAPLSTRYSAALFNRAGEHLGSLGRDGDGPGDYRSITAAATLPTDSIVVLEGTLSLHAPNLAFVREEVLSLNGRPRRLAVLPDGRMALDVSGAGTGYFAYVRPDLSVERQFGAESRTDGGYHIAGDAQGGLWAVPFGSRWELLHFDSVGTRVNINADPPSWYQEPDPGAARMGDPRVQRPDARFAGVWSDSAGQVWVAAVVADRQWQADPDGLPDPADHGGEVTHGIMMIDRWPQFFDGAIAVYDGATGKLVSERIVENVIALSPEGLLGELVVTEGNDIEARVLTGALSRR